MNRQPIVWKKIITNHISGKRLITYKEVSISQETKNSKTCNLLKKKFFNIVYIVEKDAHPSGSPIRVTRVKVWRKGDGISEVF